MNMNLRPYITHLLILLCLSSQSKAQNCFEINRILVDACGSPEGENEMVFFTVGNTPLSTSTLNVAWANTNANWLGVSVSQQTQVTTAALNATIQACGYLVEPIGGVLPAFSKVILITSENMNPAFNSFSALADTVYIIYQTAGNTAGHFKNFPSPNPRTLTINFGACSDVVSYIPDSLIDQAGLHIAADGATVEFDAAGNATYTNTGCQAPVNVLGATTSASDSTVCPGASITLIANNITGNYAGFFWSGGNGVIITPADTVTQYQTNGAFTGTDIIYFGLIGTCLDTVLYPVQIQIGVGNTPVITSSGPTTFCNGDSVTLTVNNGSSYLWSTGDTTASITVNQTANYSVTVTGACGVSTVSQQVNVVTSATTSISANGPVTFCLGDSVTLTASGTGIFLWSNGSISSSITVFQTGNYSVILTSSCGSDTAYQQVNVTTGTPISITPSGATTFCAGSSITLTASGGAPYLWSTGATTATVTVNTSGTYTVTGNSSCGNNVDSVLVTVLQPPTATITANGPTTFCQGGSVTLTAAGGSSYLWSGGQATPAITVNSGTAYTVTVTNLCGNSTATQNITVNPLPVASIAASGSTTFCQGGSVTLTALGGNSYVWSNGSVSNSISVSLSGTYIVTATNQCGNDTASISVESVVAPQSQIISSTNPLVLCPDETLQLQAVTNNSYIYQWSSGDTTSTINVNNGGLYSLTVTNICGSSVSSVTISQSNLQAAATANPLSGIAPLNVSFANGSSNYNSLQWNFGDGSASSTLASPQHTYTSYGSYTATLTVADTLGCSVLLSFNIFVDEIVNFSLPNIITPNGDNRNDNFEFITNAGVEEYTITIYNRWGKEIRRITSSEIKIWDGKNDSGNECSAGSYFYSIEITTVKNEVVKKRGLVEIEK
jgi:gliding motility-associated-like protein